jgi:hypothetical protein
MIRMGIFLQVKTLNVPMNISKALMKMLEKFPQVEILKELKMVMRMMDQIPQVENLKTTMFVIMNLLLVRILKVLIKSFLQVRISKA